MLPPFGDLRRWGALLTTRWLRSFESPNESPNEPVIFVARHRAAADYKRLLALNTALLNAPRCSLR